jgi:hypothetical protein
VNQPVPPVNRTGFLLSGNGPVHGIINPARDFSSFLSPQVHALRHVKPPCDQYVPPDSVSPLSFWEAAAPRAPKDGRQPAASRVGAARGHSGEFFHGGARAPSAGATWEPPWRAYQSGAAPRGFPGRALPAATASGPHGDLTCRERRPQHPWLPPVRRQGDSVFCFFSSFVSFFQNIFL